MDQVQILKDKGNAALAANNSEEAVKYYTDAIALDGENHVLYSNRSAAFVQCGKYEEALKDAEKTIELKPDWVKGYFRKGCALASLGEFSQAGNAFQQALNIDPNNVEIKEAISNLITINMKSLLKSPVVDQVMEGVPVNPEDLKRIKFLKENPNMTYTECKKDPRMLKLMRDLNIDVFGAGETMDVDPQSEPAAQTSDENEKNPQAGNADNTKLSIGKEEALKEKILGNEAYKKKEFETALKHYFKAVELNPTEITYYNNIAAVYFEQKEYKKCIEQCEKAIEIGRENRADFKLIAKAFTRIGNSYKKLNDLYNAKIYYEKSLSEHRTPEVRTLLSDVEKVIKEQERKAYIDPVKAEEEKEKGNDLFKKGDYAGAVKHYTEAIKRNPDEAKYYSNRAACYTKLAAFDLGLKDCEMCLKLDPKFFKGWVRKGKILQGMQQYGKALVAYQKALDLDPHNSEALEGYRTCSVAVHSNPEEVRKRAMADPEVQAILQDPAMRLILEQMQNDPKALQDHLRNPDIAAKIQKLLESGLIAIH